MNEDTPSGEERRAETARLLSVHPDELDYIGDGLDEEIGEQTDEEAPPSDEEVPEIEVAASEARGLVVPNRISYGVYLQVVGFDGNRTRWAWKGLRDVCTHTTWYYLWSDSFSRYERAGWCRRPQTDTYDIRYKIYWRASGT